MNDLSKYLALKAKIEALGRENAELTAKVARRDVKLEEARAEITAQKKRARHFELGQSRWRTKYEAVEPAEKKARLARRQKALDMIAARESGDLVIRLKAIAAECGIKEGTVRHMAFEYRKAITN